MKENEEKSRIRIQNLRNKFKIIQNYLLCQSDNFVKVDVDLNDTSRVLDFMHDYILEKIRNSYAEGEF